MYKIYTPQAWYAVFGGYPTLVIEDDGKIYPEEEAHKLMRNPIGLVDFDGGYIYGEDYLSLMRSPIGKVTQDGDVTRIYGSDYLSLFAQPIFYIKNNRIYSADEMYRLFPQEAGFVEGSAQRNTRAGASLNDPDIDPALLAVYLREYEDDDQEPGFLVKLVVSIPYLIGALVVLAMCAYSVNYYFINPEETRYAWVAWGSLALGGLAALVLGKAIDSDIITTLVVSGGSYIVLEFKDMFTGAAPWDGYHILALILSPVAAFFVFIGPALIVGLLVAVLKGHLQQALKERREKKAEK